MSGKPELEGAVSVVLSSEDLRALVADYAEVGLDTFIQEGVARDIPIVNSLLALGRIGATVHDRLFTKKLLAFLGPWAEVSVEDRAALVTKLEADPAYGRKVAEHLIEILDRIESHKKPKMLARVFRAYNAGEIDAKMLHRLVYAIQQVPVFEVAYLRIYRDPNASVMPIYNIDEVSMQNLAGASLVTVSRDLDLHKVKYPLTAVGREFMRLDLDRLD